MARVPVMLVCPSSSGGSLGRNCVPARAVDWAGAGVLLLLF